MKKILKVIISIGFLFIGACGNDNPKLDPNDPRVLCPLKGKITNENNFWGCQVTLNEQTTYTELRILEDDTASLQSDPISENHFHDDFTWEQTSCNSIKYNGVDGEGQLLDIQGGTKFGTLHFTNQIGDEISTFFCTLKSE